MRQKSGEYSVELLAGLGGKKIKTSTIPRTPGTVNIEAVPTTLICPKITLHSTFQWFDADGLYVNVCYGFPGHGITLWVPKPSQAVLNSGNDFKFQIPGKNGYSFNNGDKTLVGFEFRFVNLRTYLCQEPRHLCSENSGVDERCLGAIWVSIKRMRLEPGATPTSMFAFHHNLATPSWCQHSEALVRTGVKYGISMTQRAAPFNIGTIVENPNLSQFQELTTGGKWMSCIFAFRPKEAVWERSVSSEASSDEGSEKELVATGTNINNANLGAAMKRSPKVVPQTTIGKEQAERKRVLITADEDDIDKSKSHQSKRVKENEVGYINTDDDDDLEEDLKSRSTELNTEEHTALVKEMNEQLRAANRQLKSRIEKMKKLRELNKKLNKQYSTEIERVERMLQNHKD